jgi:glutamine cyclotransferase
VELETGEVLQQVDLDEQHFGEGIAVVGDRIFQLTWQSNVAFVYDRTTLTVQEQFDYPTEGWGLTYDDTDLIMSDGTATLYRRDPQTFAETGRVDVRAGGDYVPMLNELEYVDGEVFANIWQTDMIARIDPATGEVVGWIDLSGLMDAPAAANPDAVLNGIAYDATGDRLFLTGKLWPTLFEIDLVPPTP